MRYLPGIDIERDFYSLGTICRNMKDGRIGYDRDGMEILLNNKALSKIIESIFIGIPLPLFSYGGSSLWGFTILLSILLRLDAERESRF